MIVSGLPAAAELIRAVRESGASALDAYIPAIDERADMETLARFLGISYASVQRMRQRTRRDGTPEWPPVEPGMTYGRSPTWTYRTLILHRAAMPGRGAPGRPRKRG